MRTCLQTRREASGTLSRAVFACSKRRIGAEDERLARRIGEHPQQLFWRETGFASGWRGDDDAVEVFDVPESFEGVDWSAAAFDACVDRDACS